MTDVMCIDEDCSQMKRQDVPPSLIQVRVCVNNGSATYIFRCKNCHMVTVRPANEIVCDMLRASGSEVVEWCLPWEMLERPGGPSFTDDDQINFHRLMQTETWFDDLRAHIERPVTSLSGMVDWANILHQCFPFQSASGQAEE